MKRMMLLALILGVAPACVLEETVTMNNTSNNQKPGTNNKKNNPMKPVSDFKGGTVEEDITIAGDITLTDSVGIIKGAKLTIEAGSTITMCADCNFIVGKYGDAGTIIAEGTSSQPIRFIGESDEAGYWDKIILEKNTTSNSILSNVEIKNAGGIDYALRVEKNVTLEDLTIDGSGKTGLYLEDLKEGSSNIVVKNSKDYPVEIANTQVLSNFPVDGDYAGNGDDLILVTARTLEGDVVVPNPEIPYLLKKGWGIEEGQVTISAGTVLKVAADQSIVVGIYGTASEIIAEGTSSQPIIIEGENPEKGYWGGIVAEKNTRQSSVLSKVTVRHGGPSCLNSQMKLTLKDVTLEDCKGHGLIHDVDHEFGDGSKNLTITGVEGRAAKISATSMTSLPTGGDFSGNDDDCIETGRSSVENITGTVPNPGIPYCVEKSIGLQEGAKWTIAPGSVFIFNADTDLIVGKYGTSASLIAEGTSSERIEFRSRDNSNGFWKGVHFDSDVLSTSTLKHVLIEYGGKDNAANLKLDRSGIVVEDCEFKNSAGFGLHLNYDTQDSIDYAGKNTFSGNTKGDIEDERN